MKIQLNAAARLTAHAEVLAKNAEEAGKVFLALQPILGEPVKKKESKVGVQEVKWKGPGFIAYLTLTPGDGLHFMIELPRSKKAREALQRRLEYQRRHDEAYRSGRGTLTPRGFGGGGGGGPRSGGPGPRGGGGGRSSSRPSSNRGFGGGSVDEGIEVEAKNASAMIKEIRIEAKDLLETRRGNPIVQALAKLKPLT